MGYLARMRGMPGQAHEHRTLHKQPRYPVGCVPALNGELFDSLAELLAPAILAQIYGEFLAQTRIRLHALGQSDDLDAVQATAHTVKGTAGMLGATYIAAVAAQLEDDPVTGSDLSAALAEIAEGCMVLETALKGRQVLE